MVSLDFLALKGETGELAAGTTPRPVFGELGTTGD
jgi:hypothetical protein